jgi:hypothetical protein
VLAPAFEAAQTRLLRGKDARFDPTPPSDHGSIELGSRFALRLATTAQSSLVAGSRSAVRRATKSSWSSISPRTWIGATI